MQDYRNMTFRAVHWRFRPGDVGLLLFVFLLSLVVPRIAAGQEKWLPSQAAELTPNVQNLVFNGAFGWEATQTVTPPGVRLVSTPAVPRPPAVDGSRRAIAFAMRQYAGGVEFFLPTTPREARAVAATLGTLGFNHEVHVDLTGAQMREALADFKKEIQGADTAVIYVAAHGLLREGRRLMILPVDAPPSRPGVADGQGVPLELLYETLKGCVRRGIILLDICESGDVLAGRQIPLPPPGVLVVHAAMPGAPALDGNAGFGVFTERLLGNLGDPGVAIETVLERVRAGVAEDTGGRQQPWWKSVDFEAGFSFWPVHGVVATAPDLGNDAGRLEEYRRRGWEEWFEAVEDRLGVPLDLGFPAGRSVLPSDDGIPCDVSGLVESRPGARCRVVRRLEACLEGRVEEAVAIGTGDSLDEAVREAALVAYDHLTDQVHLPRLDETGFNRLFSPAPGEPYRFLVGGYAWCRAEDRTNGVAGGKEDDCDSPSLWPVAADSFQVKVTCVERLMR